MNMIIRYIKNVAINYRKEEFLTGENGKPSELLFLSFFALSCIMEGQKCTASSAGRRSPSPAHSHPRHPGMRTPFTCITLFHSLPAFNREVSLRLLDKNPVQYKGRICNHQHPQGCRSFLFPDCTLRNQSCAVQCSINQPRVFT